MKKTHSTVARWITHLAIKSFLVVSCLMFSISAYSQQQKQAEMTDPLEIYATQHPTPLAKLFLADPDNQQLAHAIKCAYILDNAELKSNYKPADISTMEQEVSSMQSYATHMQKNMDSGMSKERAAKLASEQVQKSRTETKPVPVNDPTRMNTATPAK